MTAINCHPVCPEMRDPVVVDSSVAGELKNEEDPDVSQLAPTCMPVPLRKLSTFAVSVNIVH
jgi:hypothetical protein